jgi:hypothetical protein
VLGEDILGIVGGKVEMGMGIDKKWGHRTTKRWV